jgi:hypothetical protein
MLLREGEEGSGVGKSTVEALHRPGSSFPNASRSVAKCFFASL